MTDLKDDKVGEEVEFEEAYERVKAEIAAIPADELMAINLDVTAAVKTALGALPEIRALRAEIAELPRFDMGQFDKIETYARALGHAQTRVLLSMQPSDDLVAAAAEGTKLREVLKNDVTALAGRGLVDSRALSQLKGPVGYMNLAQDLDLLGNLLKDNWSTVEKMYGTKFEEIVRAKKLGAHIVAVLGLREQGPALVAAAVQMRLRAFTAFMRAYERARVAIAYLRHDAGDADTIAPVVYTTKRKKVGEADSPEGSPADATTGAAGNEATLPGLGTVTHDVPAVSTGSASNGSALKSGAATEGKSPFLA